MKVITAALGLAALALAAPAVAQNFGPEKGGLDQTGPYEPVEGWFKPGIDRWDQPVTSLTIDTPNRILITVSDQRRTQPNAPMLSADGKVLPERSTASTRAKSELPHLHQIMALNADGKAVEDWAQWNDLFGLPHNIEVNPYDPARHVWVVDLEHQIIKFTNDGKKQVMKLGERGVTGTDRNHFNMPASLAFMPDGSFYVTDGYVNARIIKFDKNGKYVSEFGSKGSGPGQFDLVHSVTIDAQHRFYAADRRNNRIQVFDRDGKFLDQWRNVGSPTRLVITKDQTLWMMEANYNRVAHFDLNGKLLTYWGVTGSAPGAFDNAHNFDVDESGTLFVADAWNNRVQKFVPRKGADPARLIGQEYRLP